MFCGRDLEAAVAHAAETLGVRPETLRYFVLDAGGNAGRETRIAVLSEKQGLEKQAAPQPTDDSAAEDRRDPAAIIEEITEAIARAAGVDLAAKVRRAGADMEVYISGPGLEVLREPGLEALEQILQRAAGHRLSPGRLAIQRRGWDEGREAGLRQLVRELAAAVHADGEPRVAPPLNAYERRLVHLALTDDPGLRTFSEGSGAERRLVVARRDESQARDCRPASGRPQ